jgi:hypothetical protein
MTGRFELILVLVPTQKNIYLYLHQNLPERKVYAQTTSAFIVIPYKLH